MTYGQHGGWTYKYCSEHALMVERQQAEDREWAEKHG